MKIRYFSDLHLEYIAQKNLEKIIKQIPSGLNELCILSGDIGNPYEINYDIFMNFINKNFKKTFVITGNHEYYNKTKTIKETNVYLDNYFKQHNNIHFLNNDCEIYNNHCFIGTTLWGNITDPKYIKNEVKISIPKFDYK
jgi:predicted phosphohydrolase